MGIATPYAEMGDFGLLFLAEVFEEEINRSGGLPDTPDLRRELSVGFV